MPPSQHHHTTSHQSYRLVHHDEPPLVTSSAVVADSSHASSTSHVSSAIHVSNASHVSSTSHVSTTIPVRSPVVCIQSIAAVALLLLVSYATSGGNDSLQPATGGGLTGGIGRGTGGRIDGGIDGGMDGMDGRVPTTEHAESGKPSAARQPPLPAAKWPSEKGKQRQQDQQDQQSQKIQEGQGGEGREGQGQQDEHTAMQEGRQGQTGQQQVQQKAAPTDPRTNDKRAPVNKARQKAALIPGSSIVSPQSLKAFKARHACLASHGAWRLDPAPRLLPWTPSDRWGGWQCDAAWTVDAEHTGHVARGEADQVVLQGRPAGDWRVRQEAKYRWLPHKKCGKWEELEGRKIVELLEGRRMLIVGDSISGMSFFSLRNHLMQQQTASTAAMEGPGKFPTEDLVPEYCKGRTKNAELAKRPKLMTCAEIKAGNASIVHIRDDVLSTGTDPVVIFPGQVSIPWFDQIQPGTGTSILVINRGAHYRGDSQFIPQLNKTLSIVRAAAPDLLIIYRSTPPGHAHCDRLKTPLRKRQNPMKLPYHWGDFGAQNAVAKQLVEGVGGVFLDVDPMTVLRPDGHLDPPRDCLHYCLPGPPDEWIRLLYHMLKDLL
ncbi:hypothetical protein CLOM_g18522 [Closterium sp. NIES-68]|nr:hypothetical protein CLOM_g18522 [Closterium sp. NIES-68]GJP66923.1 hypothetical protein CLOP_g23792 [Closterium sp. NIES-67]